MSGILPQAFYARECLEVAIDLIGKLLCHGAVTLRITEVEAYRYPGDTANHCRFGKTARNAPMWGAPGHAYVYLCYGIHQMLNLVTDGEESGAAVLVRSCEPVTGLEQVRARRGGERGYAVEARGAGRERRKDGPVLLTGPGKVGAALGLDVSFSHHPLFSAGGLEVRDATPVGELLVGPRVGVDYADSLHRDAPWRIAQANTRWVSQRASLRPLELTRERFLARERLPDADSSIARALKRRKTSP